jgi:hypothetical protein
MQIKQVNISVEMLFRIIKTKFKAVVSLFSKNTYQYNALVKTVIGIHNYEIVSCYKS